MDFNHTKTIATLPMILPLIHCLRFFFVTKKIRIRDTFILTNYAYSFEPRENEVYEGIEKMY